PTPRSTLFPYTTLFRSMVELLVVIAIIAILATLLVVALGPARDRARELQVRSDLTQFDTSLAVYKQKFQIPPPSFGELNTSTNPDRKSTRLNSSHRTIS